jgi:mono/diheme cytochrome c family protein
MTADIRTLRVALALLIVVAIAALTLAGCSAEQTVAEEGQFSCIGCHTDRDLLKADLKADPKPEKVVAESEGEG